MSKWMYSVNGQYSGWVWMVGKPVVSVLHPLTSHFKEIQQLHRQYKSCTLEIYSVSDKPLIVFFIHHLVCKMSESIHHNKKQRKHKISSHWRSCNQQMFRFLLKKWQVDDQTSCWFIFCRSTNHCSSNKHNKHSSIKQLFSINFIEKLK